MRLHAATTPWRRLEQLLRKAYPDQVKAWRSSTEPKPPQDQEQLFSVVDELLRAVGGRFALALAGVYSQDPVLVDQRRLLTDLMSIPGWETYGRQYTVAATSGLVSIFHHLHGALCCELGRYDLALQFAQAGLVDVDMREPIPLFRLHSQHWPKLLDKRPWEYLASLRTRFPLVRELFPLENDFDVALTTYSMLLTLLELGRDANSTLAQMQHPHFTNIERFDVPPRFLQMNSDLIRSGIERTFDSRDTVALVLHMTGASKDDVAKVWPLWRDSMLRWHRQHVGWGSPYNAKLGDLALP